MALSIPLPQPIGAESTEYLLRDHPISIRLMRVASQAGGVMLQMQITWMHPCIDCVTVKFTACLVRVFGQGPSPALVMTETMSDISPRVARNFRLCSTAELDRATFAADAGLVYVYVNFTYVRYTLSTTGLCQMLDIQHKTALTDAMNTLNATRDSFARDATTLANMIECATHEQERLAAESAKLDQLTKSTHQAKEEISTLLNQTAATHAELNAKQADIDEMLRTMEKHGLHRPVSQSTSSHAPASPPAKRARMSLCDMAAELGSASSTEDADVIVPHLVKALGHYTSALEKSDRCCVCMTAPANCVFTGCGHVCVCEPCANKVGKKCPICNAESDWRRTFRT